MALFGHQNRRKWRQTIKNKFTQCLLGLFKLAMPKRFSWDATAPRILLVATTAVGDSIWLTPLLPAIKQRYPNSYVGILCGPAGEQIFRHRSDVDAIFALPRPHHISALKIISTLRKNRFQAVLVSHLSQRTIPAVCYMTGADIRIASAGKCKGLEDLMTIVDNTDTTNLHTVDIKFLLARHLDIPEPEKPELNLVLTETEQQNADLFIKQNCKSAAPLIGLVPGASKLVRQWQPEKFIELGNWLHEQCGAHIIVIGSPKETKLCTSISEHIDSSTSAAGKITLRETMALIKRLQLIVTNDTGPMHIASSFHIPIVGFMAPVDHGVYPYNSGQKILVSTKEKNPKDWYGVHQITVAQVKAQIADHLPR